MLNRNAGSQVLAYALITILPMALAPAFAAPQAGVIHGVVLEAGNHEPMDGVTVHVADPATGIIHVSDATDNDGTFTVADLPSATYEIGLEKEGKLFLVQTPVVIAPGQSRNLAVALDENTNPADDDDTKPGLWQNPLTAALLVTGSAILVGVILENAVGDDPTVRSPIAATSAE